MKQNAIVIATLLAAVSANRAAAKARMEKDISSYLRNGLEFDTKVIKAVAADHRRVVHAQNEFKDEARENFREGHRVAAEYEAAMEYEKSQEVYTAPSAANGQWGNIHYNNPQKIMDNYVKAYKADQENGEEWREDAQKFGEQVHKSHEILGQQVDAAWKTNGIKAHEAAQDAFRTASEMRPQSLVGADSEDARLDAKKFIGAVGNAAKTVRQTMNYKGKLEAPMDNRFEGEYEQYVANRQKIAKGFGDAMKFEYENTHFDAGKKGGYGSLDWTNKQEIVDKYAAPMEASKINDARFAAQYKRFAQERMEAKKLVDAQAAKTWPPAFKRVENSWRALTDDFDDRSASLVATETVQRADLRAAWGAGADLDKAVVGDFLEFVNNTKTQRREWGDDVKTYIQNKDKINQQYKAAWDYEMKNFHATKTKSGDIQLKLDNEDQVLNNWSDAEFADIKNNQELVKEYVQYQKSIAADKAKFASTAKAEWPKKFAAYQAAAQKCNDSFEWNKTQADAVAASAPKSLITDTQQQEAEVIRAQMYENINERLAFKYNVKKDVGAYLKDTAGARAALKKDAAEWKVASKNVQDMYAAAWQYQVAQSKFTPASAKGPATLELQNPQQVSNNWRAAAQKDEDLGAEIRGDIVNYSKAIAPAKKELATEINKDWIPRAEAINKSDVQIFEEVVAFTKGANAKQFAEFQNQMAANKTEIAKPEFTHPYANLMAMENSTMTTNEQLAYGSVFLMAMIAVAALSNKGKAESKTVEFDVEDLEMTNKKESKKQIKKTLKDIMKTSNTKVSILQ